ncbi:MAG: S8 family serine peptidase [Bacteroidales bacterium]
MKKTFILLVCIGISQVAAAQQRKDIIVRENDTLQLKKIAVQSMDYALKIRENAQKNYPYPFRIEEADGSIREVQGLDDRGQLWVYGTSNLNAAKTVSTDKVWPGGGAGLNLTGNGITLAIWDGGKVRTTHQEFSGRVTQMDGASSLSQHSTHVSGTMIAAGVDANAKGMSYQATLKAYDWNIDVNEMSKEAANGLLISNHSYKYLSGWEGQYWYGDVTISEVEDYKFGFYDYTSRQMDLICNAAPYYLPVFAASNDRGNTSPGGVGYYWNGSSWVWSNTYRPPDGPYDCIPSFCGIKNGLTVGNVNDIPGGYTNPGDVVLNSSSSCGPTDDGRIKPDLVANGTSLYSTNSTGDTDYVTMTGTSMACPNTSGSLGLLQQHSYNLNGKYLKSATLKALVIATADEAGSWTGPDYQFGWGLLNTQKAAQALSNNGISTWVKELTLAQLDTFRLQVYSDGTVPLAVTIAWNDPAGVNPSPSLDPPNLMLVNDLDLRIRKDVNTWYPYVLNPAIPTGPATTGDNFRDNVEKIFIATPAAGVYTIEISHKGNLAGGLQDFGLIVTGIQNNAPLAFEANPSTPGQINLSWTLNSGKPVLLVYNTSNVFGQPVNGMSYSAGDPIPGGGTVICTGTATSFTHNSLNASQYYYYRIFSIIDGTPTYSEPNAASARTLSEPVPLPIRENFAQPGLPQGWTRQLFGNTEGWKTSNSASAGGLALEIMHLWEDLYNNYSYGTPLATSRLILPAVNTTGMSRLTLRFKHKFADLGYGISTATVRIQSSTDGVNWTNEGWSFTSRNGNLGPEIRAVPIVNNLNSPTTYVAFVIEGDFYDFWYWSVDDVELYEGPSGLWTGVVSDEWTTTSNWSDGLLPQAITPVLIPNGCTYFPKVNSDYSSPTIVADLTLLSGAQLTLNENKALTVTGTLTNGAGEAALLLKNGSTLLHGTDSVPATVERDVSGYTDYHYISSPVINTQAISAFPGWAYVRRYDETQPVNQWINLTGSDTLKSLVGYATYLPNGDVTATFMGPLHNGSLSISGLTFTPNSTIPYDGYNLVGNPYPSVLDFESTGITLTHLTSTAYFWNQELNGGLGGYATYTRGIGGTNGGSQYIGPGQGFFLKVNNPGNIGTFAVTQAARVHHTHDFYKNLPFNSLKFRIKSISGISDEMILALRQGGSPGYDVQWDAFKLRNPQCPVLYFTSSEDYELAVQTLSENPSSPVPLFFEPYENTSYTLTFSGIENFLIGIPLQLEDLKTGQVYDLRSTDSIAISAQQGDDPLRFRLWFGTVGMLISGEGNFFKSRYHAGALYLESTCLNGKAELYSLTGHKIWEKISPRLMESIPLSEGVYLLRYQCGGKTWTNKVIVYH